jgi:uncharacterized membrane protein
MSSGNLNGNQQQQNTSVFDSFTSSIRNNIVRGTQSLVNSWSECAYIVKYTRYTSYVITILLLFVVIALIVGWSRAIVMTLAIIAVLCSAFQSYLSSQESCFRVFQNAGN